MPPVLYNAYGVPLQTRFGTVTGRNVPITETAGAPGFAVYSGYVSTPDDPFDVGSRTNLYRSYQQMVRDTGIVAAGIHFYLNVIAKEKWSFEPSEADTTGQYAELAEVLLMSGDTAWPQIVRRASLYRFYGFTVQEWIARHGTSDEPSENNEDESGLITLKDLEPRPFRTIERWDTDPHGRVQGIIQRSPQTQFEYYLPVGKVLYLVDRALSDAPYGFGLMRSMISPARQLSTYERLEAIGMENDLRGIPVVRYPKTELDQLVDNGELTTEQAAGWRKPLEDFIKKHGRSEESGIMLDSGTYEAQDEAARPSNVRRWDVEILRGGTTALRENNAAIARKNREIARIMGAEGLLLGESVGASGGNYALSKDKTHIFFVLVDGALLYMRDAVERQLLRTFWRLNGLPPEMMPSVKTEAVRYSDVEEVTAALRDMATAGAPLVLNDPAINDVRAMLGITPQPEQDPIEVQMPDEPEDDDPPEDTDDLEDNE